MLIINMASNLAQFTKGIEEKKRSQIPFAAAQALTEMVRSIDVAEQRNEETRLDRPRPFTLNATRVLPARKDTLIARLVMMDRTASYLAPYDEGGFNKLNSKALLKPVSAKSDLDQYGNIPRSYLPRLRQRKDVFIGPVQTKIGVVNGIWQRSTEPGTPVMVVHVNKKTGKVTKRRTRKGGQSSGRLKLIVKFTDAHPIAQKNRLDWHGVAQKDIDRTFRKTFGKWLGIALAMPPKP